MDYDDIDHTGVHTSHCCARHGCKYCDDDCPVFTKLVIQEYDCEDCCYEQDEIKAMSEEEIVYKLEQFMKHCQFPKVKHALNKALINYHNKE